MDASQHQDQENKDKNNSLINDEIRYQISKERTIRNCIFPLSIDLWDIEELIIYIDQNIQKYQLSDSSKILSKLSKLKKLSIIISHKNPEEIINSILVDLFTQINLSDMKIEFRLKQDSNKQEDFTCRQINFFKDLSKLIGLQKLSCSFLKQSNADVSTLLGSIGSLPNLSCLTLDLEVVFFQNGRMNKQLEDLFQRKQLQFNLHLRAWFSQVELIRNCLFQPEIPIKHLSLVCRQQNLNFLDVSTLAKAISTFKNLEYLELDVGSDWYQKTEKSMLNPFINASSFVNLLKLKNLKISFKGYSSHTTEIQEWILQAVSKLKDLLILTLTINSSTYQKNLAPLLGESLSNLLQLTELQINMQNMKIPNNEYLLQGISKLTALITLSLSLSFIPSHDNVNRDFFELSVCIAKLEKLKILRLQLKNYQVTGQQIAALTSAIANLSGLSCLELYLTGLQFGEESMVHFTSETCRLTGDLRELHLDLTRCEIRKKEAEHFSIGISKITNLISLGITGSNLSFDLFNGVLSEASKLPSLRILITNNVKPTPQLQYFLKKSSHLVDIRRR